jgi:hypothetical protein
MTDMPHLRTVELSDTELVILNNALNEVCNGVDFGDDEFRTRLGASRKEARALMVKLSSLLEGPMV